MIHVHTACTSPAYSWSILPSSCKPKCLLVRIKMARAVLAQRDFRGPPRRTEFYCTANAFSCVYKNDFFIEDIFQSASLLDWVAPPILFSFVRSLYSSRYHKHDIGNSEWVNRKRFQTQLVNLTPPVDHASCSEENDCSFPRPTCNLWLSLSGNSQATSLWQYK